MQHKSEYERRLLVSTTSLLHRLDLAKAAVSRARIVSVLSSAVAISEAFYILFHCF
jgi:hypothetical protein